MSPSWQNNLEISTETARLILLITTAICLIILSPISLYYAKQLWHLNNEDIPFITNRHAKVVIISVIGWSIFPTIIRPLVDLNRVNLPNKAKSKWSMEHILLIQTFQFLQALICIRLWLLYYDYFYGIHFVNSKWKTTISQSMAKLQESNTYWTLKYRFLGNVRYVTIAGMSIACLFILIIVLAGSKHLNLTQLLSSSWLILVIVMAIKIRKCRDEFSIQKEFRIILGFMLLFNLSYVGMLVLLPKGSNIRLVMTNIGAVIGSYCISMISTYWVITQYRKELFANIESQTSTDQDVIANRLTLEEILSSKDGFDLFANHLVKEFSIENLAFLFEVMQIKRDVIAHGLVSAEHAGMVIPIATDRINKVRRRSSVLYCVEDLKMNIRSVMENYMYHGSEFSVNVSAFTRMTALNNYDLLGLRMNPDCHERKQNTIQNGDETDIEDEDEKEHSYSYSGGNSPKSSDSAHPPLITRANCQRELILKYVTIFDRSLEEIIGLLKLDSLSRFYRSKEYKIMTQKD